MGPWVNSHRHMTSMTLQPISSIPLPFLPARHPLVTPPETFPCSSDYPRGPATQLQPLLIRQVLKDPDQLEALGVRLLEVCSSMLCPPWTGWKSHNLTTLINRQIKEYEEGKEVHKIGPERPSIRRKGKDDEENVARRASVKLD